MQEAFQAPIEVKLQERSLLTEADKEKIMSDLMDENPKWGAIG